MNFFRLLFSATIILIISCSATNYDAARPWTKLGAKVVNYDVDKDILKVGVKDGRFDKIKLVVKAAPLNFHRCVVHFGNGDTQVVQLRKNFKRGTSSVTHDLNGRDRIITHVVFWYDTKNKANRRAKVEVWAR